MFVREKHNWEDVEVNESARCSFVGQVSWLIIGALGVPAPYTPPFVISLFTVSLVNQNQQICSSDEIEILLNFVFYKKKKSILTENLRGIVCPVEKCSLY